MLSLLLVVAFGAGIGLSELRRQQSDRDAADRRGSELALGAILLERHADADRVVLRVQVQNRGPEPVRLVEVSAAGTTIRSNPGEPDRRLLPAGEDRSVVMDASLGCTDGGASLTVPGRLTLTVIAETSRGGRRTTDVGLTTPPSLDAFSDLSRDSLDRLCGVLPPEQALQAYTLGGPGDGGDGTRGNALRVELLNQSRLPQRLLGVASPLGDAAILRDGVPLTLPLTIPAGGSTTGTFPLGGTTPPQTFSLPVTIVIACGSPRVTGVDPDVYLSFDAGAGTARQQTNVQGSFGHC